MELVHLGIAALTVVLGAVLAFMFFRGSSASSQGKNITTTDSVGAEGEAAKGDEFPAGPLAIFFGSQTGTAEGFAEVLGEEGKKHGFDTRVIDLEDFDDSEMASIPLAVFCIATYGEGDPTDSATNFVSWVKNSSGDLAEDALAHMSFAVFGLGNTQYEHFNKMGKVADSSLEAVGAERVFELGLGDDDGSLEEDFEQWKEKLWPCLVEKFHPGNPAGATETNGKDIPDIPFKTVGTQEEVERRFQTQEINSSTKHYFQSTAVKVVVNRELRSEKDGGSTRHIEVAIHDTGVKYQTADNLAVLPENDDSSVECLAKALGFDLDEFFKLEAVSGAPKHPFPTPCSVRHALKSYCDINGRPRRSDLKHLIPFATDAEDKETLTMLVSKDGRQLFKEMIEDPQRSFLEIVANLFPSIKMPLAHFLHAVPRLQPRYYTISSSSSAHPTRIHMTVSVINEVKPDGSMLQGVCSSYLQRLVPPATAGGKRVDEGPNGKRGSWPMCRVFVRDSSFRLPAAPKTPILLIGPGTGIAPMRALLQERAWQKSEGLDVGPAILYFGCKRQEMDFLYQEELEEFKTNGALTTLHTAFSRQGSTKVYVQHLLARPENSRSTWDLVDKHGAYIYVCGGTSMGASVGQVLQEIVAREGKLSAAQAGAVLDNLKSEGRYVQELWA